MGIVAHIEMWRCSNLYLVGGFVLARQSAALQHAGVNRPAGFAGIV